MTKFKLEVEYDYDFALIGICSHEKDYRLCWAINKDLGVELKKQEDVELRKKDARQNAKFSLYMFDQEELYTQHYIISNKSGKSMLIPEQKQADYLFMIKSNNHETEAEEMLQKLKKISMILTAYKIDPSKLKSKQNLLF